MGTLAQTAGADDAAAALAAFADAAGGHGHAPGPRGGRARAGLPGQARHPGDQGDGQGVRQGQPGQGRPVLRLAARRRIARGAGGRRPARCPVRCSRSSAGSSAAATARTSRRSGSPDRAPALIRGRKRLTPVAPGAMWRRLGLSPIVTWGCPCPVPFPPRPTCCRSCPAASTGTAARAPASWRWPPCWPARAGATTPAAPIRCSPTSPATSTTPPPTTTGTSSPLLIPEVVGLTSDDPRIDARIALRCATTALPVASEERQNVLAVSVLSADCVLAELDGRQPDDLEPAVVRPSTRRRVRRRGPLVRPAGRRRREGLQVGTPPPAPCGCRSTASRRPASPTRTRSCASCSSTPSRTPPPCARPSRRSRRRVTAPSASAHAEA